jgi:SsrA-binding protein
MKILAKNKRAYRDYQIIDTYEAGVVLNGSEVKSAKNSQISIKEAYVHLSKDNQAYLVGSHIAPYQKGASFKPDRERKLLLSKRELVKLSTKIKESNLALIPIKAYLKKGYLKIEIGLGRKKKKQDKREDLKNKAQQTDIKKELQ